MQPFNPFLRAFFRSNLPSQCSPAHQHILLVPSTELLLTARDRETHVLYSDLATNEEFLASHVLRVPGGVAPSAASKDGAATFRENRTKAKQYTTLNGRTVIVKDTFVYSNKGFKSLNQVQLINDAIYYPDSFDAQPWLIYYISKPLIGTVEIIKITPASPDHKLLNGVASPTSPHPNGASSALAHKKKDIHSFTDLLNNFPMIARQMQSGLDRLFKEFGKAFEKPLPALPVDRPTTPISIRRRNSTSSVDSALHSLSSNLTNGTNGHFATNLDIGDEEELMRLALETAVTAAIDLFQMVDKSQLSLLGATTELTGTMVERMIERYVTEQVHDKIVFPKLCAIRRQDDVELESRVRQMVDIDISQVGLSVEGGPQAKRELAIRLAKGVDVFKKMGVAGSPQEMMETLLATEKLITMSQPLPPHSQPTTDGEVPNSEKKQDLMLTINADTLVSLLLIVVIRSSVRHLQARLSYMRHFIFIDDVESGEMGYALSTFEAVLSYLVRDSAGLRRSSRRNKRLWEATKAGNVAEIRMILDPDSVTPGDELLLEIPPSPDSALESFPRPWSSSGATTNGASQHENLLQSPITYETNGSGSLNHVFPFQRCPSPPPPEERPKLKKRVSVQSRSTSSSSGYSIASFADTIASRNSYVEDDTSIETLTQTRSADGESVLMMAVEGGQDKSLGYFLSIKEHYPHNVVLEDENNEGTTLLSAAVQSGHRKVTDTLLDFILDHADNERMLHDYMSRQDTKGRCAAHYLYNYPRLITQIGRLLPWRLKDRNGQTPLFALCRSYDHEDYRWMVDAAIMAAACAQHDGDQLHLDDHVDSKGNTLLHIINDAQVAAKLLLKCDSDANASNDKQFTPLMVASKYGRTDMVRVLFGDPRVDLHAKDNRGLTATELAKDDDVRNRIDDLVLLATRPAIGARTTTVVRSYFVEDGTIRFIVKSGAQNPNSTITVTTSRRALTDFENLAKWLALEHPASWIPSISGFPSPFLIPSKPSRAIARDMQLRFDSFLKMLLCHSTFATHEMVWEFFLVPDMDPQMLAQRSVTKAEARAEMVRDEYTPITDIRDVELFVSHAKDSVRSVHHSTKSVLRRVSRVRLAQTDLSDATNLASNALSTLTFLPEAHKKAFARYSKTQTQLEFSPLASFYYSTHAISTTITALLTALNRPTSLIAQMSTTQKTVDRHALSLRRSDRWPTSLSLLDETRHRMQRDAQDKIDKSQAELEGLGRELRYTTSVVAGELAMWQEERVRWGREACRDLARRMVVVERDRLEGMRRVLRGAGIRERVGEVSFDGIGNGSGSGSGSGRVPSLSKGWTVSSNSVILPPARTFTATAPLADSATVAGAGED